MGEPVEEEMRRPSLLRHHFAITRISNDPDKQYCTCVLVDQRCHGRFNFVFEVLSCFALRYVLNLEGISDLPNEGGDIDHFIHLIIKEQLNHFF